MHERTRWFIIDRDLPSRVGWYETCLEVGGDVARMYWNGEDWEGRIELVGRFAIAYWRGLVAEAR